ADLRRKVLAAYDGYQFRQAHLLLFDFCNDTLSATYLHAVKDRLYCDRADSPRRRSTQRALWTISEVIIGLLAPILPHTADEAWRALHGDDASVHRTTFPEVSADADAGWDALLLLRESVAKALEEAKERGIENPLDAGVTVPDGDGSLAPFLAELPDLFGVSRVHLDPTESTIVIHDLRDQPRCERSWRRDETVQQRADGGWLSDRDAEAVGLG
ncbi:MAG: class I tRNA ligase family protein, partial [Acidobacteria bacterium]|nr:class I tRNA ligase family protein [Acidobacteriota bacterium]